MIIFSAYVAPYPIPVCAHSGPQSRPIIARTSVPSIVSYECSLPRSIPISAVLVTIPFVSVPFSTILPIIPSKVSSGPTTSIILSYISVCAIASIPIICSRLIPPLAIGSILSSSLTYMWLEWPSLMVVYCCQFTHYYSQSVCLIS